MNRHVVGKQEIRERVLRIVPIQRTAGELAQLELVEGINRVRIAGTRKPRRFAKIAAGELFPLRLLDRITSDAVGAGCTEVEFTQAILPAVRNLIRRRFRKVRPQHDTGEMRAMA